MQPVHRSVVADIALLLVLWSLLGPAIAPGTREAVLSGFYLALYIHVGVSLYYGVFGRWRVATWLGLLAAWWVAEAGSFLGLVIPWGQVAFWAGSVLHGLPLVGPSAFDALGPGLGAVPAALWTALAIGLLLADLAAMQAPRWRGRPAWHAAVLLAGLLAALAIGRFLAGGEAPSTADHGTLPRIVWPWHALPLYAILRAVPDKLAAIAVMAAAMLAPAIAPWMRAERLRLGRRPSAWRLACCALACVWIGFGYLAALPSDDLGSWELPLLMALYFAFFLIVPLLSRRMGLSDRAIPSDPTLL